MEKQIQVQVTAQQWRDLLAARVRATAAQKEFEPLNEQLGIDGERFAAALGLPAIEGSKCHALVIDGNGAPIGKLAVSFSPASVREVKAYWRAQPS